MHADQCSVHWHAGNGTLLTAHPAPDIGCCAVAAPLLPEPLTWGALLQLLLAVQVIHSLVHGCTSGNRRREQCGTRVQAVAACLGAACLCLKSTARTPGCSARSEQQSIGLICCHLAYRHGMGCVFPCFSPVLSTSYASQARANSWALAADGFLSGCSCRAILRNLYKSGLRRCQFLMWMCVPDAEYVSSAAAASAVAMAAAI